MLGPDCSQADDLGVFRATNIRQYWGAQKLTFPVIISCGLFMNVNPKNVFFYQNPCFLDPILKVEVLPKKKHSSSKHHDCPKVPQQPG